MKKISICFALFAIFTLCLSSCQRMEPGQLFQLERDKVVSVYFRGRNLSGVTPKWEYETQDPEVISQVVDALNGFRYQSTLDEIATRDFFHVEVREKKRRSGGKFSEVMFNKARFNCEEAGDRWYIGEPGCLQELWDLVDGLRARYPN